MRSPRTLRSLYRLSTLVCVAVALTWVARPAHCAVATPAVAVGAQYDTTHVYVEPADVDRFVSSFLATFGGQSTQQVVATVTPTPSSTTAQLLRTPVGSVSLFGFKTPPPCKRCPKTGSTCLPSYGREVTGYEVMNLEQTLARAKSAGVAVLVEPCSSGDRTAAMILFPGGYVAEVHAVQGR
jgi:hypothetical protein